MSELRHSINTEELFGRNGMINDSFSALPNRQFIPKGLYAFAARSKNLRYLGCYTDEIAGGSINFSYEESKLGAIGEFIERYRCSILYDKELIYGSYENLSSKGISLLHPDTLSLFAEWQYHDKNFPFIKFTTLHEVHWIEGRSYLTDAKVYIPAFLVFMILIDSNGINNKFIIPTSTGQAAGRTLKDAILGGFFEVIERNAFCDFWYNQNSKNFISYNPELILESFPDEKIKKLFYNDRVNLKVFDLGNTSPTEVIVVFIFFNYKNRLFNSVGAAARFNKKDAIIKACLEAYQGIDFAIQTFNNCKWDNNFEKVLPYLNTFDDHFNFYNFFPELRTESPFFQKALDKNDSSDKIIHFKRKIKSINKEEIKDIAKIESLLYVDLSSKENLFPPFKVTKVIIPECALLSGVHRYPFLGGKTFIDKDNLFLKLPHCFP